MLSLPQELVRLLAECDPNTWIKLYIYDPIFCEYAITSDGKARFIELFTEHITLDDRIETRLFNRLQSIDDKPAVIHQDGHQEWFHNGERHRNGEPAISWPAPYYVHEYYQHGLLSRDNNQAPVTISLHYAFFKRRIGKDYIWGYNRPNRDFAKPAVEYMRGNFIYHIVLHKDIGSRAHIKSQNGEFNYSKLRLDHNKPTSLILAQNDDGS